MILAKSHSKNPFASLVECRISVVWMESSLKICTKLLEVRHQVPVMNGCPINCWIIEEVISGWLSCSRTGCLQSLPFSVETQWSYQNGIPLNLNNESKAGKTWESWEIHFLSHFSPHSGFLKENLGRSLDGCHLMEVMHCIFLGLKWCSVARPFLD